MKKIYMHPAMKVQEMETELMNQISGTETDTTPIHTDDPQEPGNALSRRGVFWDEE